MIVDLIHIFYFLDLFKESVLTSFDNEWDVMPRGRVKVVHSIGGVCKFTLNIQNSIYSGLLKNGERTGIIRMGSARDVSASAGVKPGVALKFLRTGRLSANFFVMNTLNSIPNQNYNFFSVPLTNHIQPSTPATTFERVSRAAGVRKFEQASICSTKVGLSDLTRLAIRCKRTICFVTMRRPDFMT